jgi:hypothetical protein
MGADAASKASGTCHLLFAYDVGWSIDLGAAEKRISAFKERSSIKHRPRAPQYLQFQPPPLRVIQETQPIPIGGRETDPAVEFLLYDFGALSVSYRVSFEGELSTLYDLSEGIYENPILLAESRRRAEELLSLLGPAIERPAIAHHVEDYAVYHLETSYPGDDRKFLHTLAQILRSERGALSDQEVGEAISHRISFGSEDAAFVDWNAAILFGREMDDVMAVLAFANAELLESRMLDRQLDLALDQAYGVLARKPWRRLRLAGGPQAESARIAQLQVDSAVFFERVNNTLKLIGDQYLSRVYRLAARRFHFDTWDAAILRKLQTLDSIYGKMSDQAAALRMEVLEWIIIALIAVSILIPFLVGASGH